MQEEIIELLLPAPKAIGRPALNPLTVFNAILWILSSGAFENILQALVANTEKYLLVEINNSWL